MCAEIYDFDLLRSASPIPLEDVIQTDWMRHCIEDKQGNKLPVVANAITGLRSVYPTLFAYDEMAMVVVFRETKKKIEDNDEVIIQKRFQLAGLKKIGRQPIHDAIRNVAMENRFHPIRDYLNSLVWDGAPRIDRLFPGYFGSADTEYERRVGACFMLSLVARIFEPGCQQDHMPVLEGDQGLLKSSACKVLAGDYFGDSLPENTRDASQYLRGKWLVEFSEMHVHDRASAAAMKSFVTRREERYFARYAHNESFEPRQCCFVGTINKSTYLKDETGGRRFWPVICLAIDIDKLRADRDQLFAEAVQRKRDGEPHWPDKAFELQWIKPQQEARFEGEHWEADIVRFLDGGGVSRITTTTVGRIAIAALKFEAPKDVKKSDAIAITRVLEHLGWRRGKKSNGVALWHRPAD